MTIRWDITDTSPDYAALAQTILDADEEYTAMYRELDLALHGDPPDIHPSSPYYCEDYQIFANHWALVIDGTAIPSPCLGPPDRIPGTLNFDWGW